MIDNLMCVERNMPVHAHVTHTLTLALALLYVHASVHIKVIQIACIQLCFMKQSEMFSKPFCTRARKRGRYTHGNLC